MLKKIISGGQTGADRAGLDAALETGFEVGGWMPAGFLAQDGLHPEFAEKYNIREHTSGKYPPRTAANVKDSDGTIRLASDWQSPGEVLTLRMLDQYNKPYIDVDPFTNADSDEVADWIMMNDIEVLNVAGNSEKTLPGIYIASKRFLLIIFRRLRREAEIVAASKNN